MTYRIRNLRTGLLFAGLDYEFFFDGQPIASWVGGDNEMASAVDFASVGLATDAILDHCLDNVEIVEVPS